MKAFVVILVVCIGIQLGCCTTGHEVTSRGEVGEVDLQSIAEFWQKVLEYYRKFKMYTKDFVCSAKLHELLDLMGVPDDLDGAVKMAQSWLCSEDDAPQKRSPKVHFTPKMKQQVLSIYESKLREVYEALKKHVKSFVCSAKLDALLDLLGLPDGYDGIVEVARGWICKDGTSRQVAVYGGTEGFFDVIEMVYIRLAELGKDKACTWPMSEILKHIQLSSGYEWAVRIVQGWICN